MENETIPASKTAKKAKNTVSVLIEGVPLWLHKRMKDYRKRINFERGKDFTLRQAYAEYLKDAAQKEQTA
jgi:hypothetical protein